MRGRPPSASGNRRSLSSTCSQSQACLGPDCSYQGDFVDVSGWTLVGRLYQQGGSYTSLRLPSFSSPKRLSGAWASLAYCLHLQACRINQPSPPKHTNTHTRRGISLLSVAGKVLARTVLIRLSDHVASTGILSESQCGFRAGRSTIDMIFSLRQLQEKCIEQHKNLFLKLST